MKKLLFISLLALISQVSAQSIAGQYEVIYDATNGYISYELVLNPDGRFSFHFYRKSDCATCVEENQYGRGRWEATAKKLTLITDPDTDVNEDFVLDLNGSKAHFIFKSPRDKTDRVVKTRLKFYESDIFWVKGMEIFKK